MTKKELEARVKYLEQRAGELLLRAIAAEGKLAAIRDALGLDDLYERRGD